MVTVLFWIIFGGLAGWIGAMINEDTTVKQTTAYITLGVFGALLGGALMYALTNTTDFTIGISNLIFPIIGSILALIAVSFLNKQSQ